MAGPSGPATLFANGPEAGLFYAACRGQAPGASFASIEAFSAE
jgi:hypothetical protein